MQAIFLIIRDIHIDDVTYSDVEDECYSDGEDAIKALDTFNSNDDEFIYSIKIINLLN